MPGAYAAFLLLSIGGLALLDYRYALVFWHSTRQASIVMAVSVTIFIVWDIAGIAANIFRIGQNELLLGLRVGEFPVEEIIFLILLNYKSFVVYCILRQRSA